MQDTPDVQNTPDLLQTNPGLLTTTHVRPLGATIIAILLVIQAILELFGVVAALTAFGSGAGGISIALIDLALAILSLVLVYGLWALKRWAFWAVVVIEVLSIAQHMFALTQPHANVASLIIRMIIPIAILIYFLADRRIRAAYRA